MEISREEILHIAKLADLKINEEELENYKKNLEDILNLGSVNTSYIAHANTINKVDTQNVDISIGTIENVNVFREDEVVPFENEKGLLENAQDKEDNMFRIPKVI